MLESNKKFKNMKPNTVDKLIRTLEPNMRKLSQDEMRDLPINI